MVYPEITTRLNVKVFGESVMPKWRKDAKEFTVGVNYNEARGYQTSIPRPVAEILGKPKAITYIVKGGKVMVQTGPPRPESHF